LKGAKECQTWAAPGSAVVPTKKARYAVLTVNTPFAVHFHPKISSPAPSCTEATAFQSLRYCSMASTVSSPEMSRAQAFSGTTSLIVRRLMMLGLTSLSTAGTIAATERPRSHGSSQNRMRAPEPNVMSTEA
jgi:hypothetical protein